MSKLLELAKRVEAGSGLDPELTAMVRCALFASTGAYVKQSPVNGAWCVYEERPSGRERSWEPRGLSPEQRNGDFLMSIDAAMSLVPEAPWPWNITMATAYGHASVIPCDGKSTGIHDPRGGHCRGAASPARALTAACLRAHSHLDR